MPRNKDVDISKEILDKEVTVRTHRRIPKSYVHPPRKHEGSHRDGAGDELLLTGLISDSFYDSGGAEWISIDGSQNATFASDVNITGTLEVDENIGIGITPTGKLHISNTAIAVDDAKFYIDTYAQYDSRYSRFVLRKSHGDTIGTATQTGTSDMLGLIGFEGVSTASAFVKGARIYAKQDAVAGATYVPANLYIETYSIVGVNTNQLVLDTDGSVSMSGNLTSVTATFGATLFTDKIKFTQVDGDEYIDSLGDGYVDYGATTGHRFGADIFLLRNNRKICFGINGAADSYIHFDGVELDIFSAGDINLEPDGALQINTVSGWSGWFDDGRNFRVTVTKGLITAVTDFIAGGHNP